MGRSGESMFISTSMYRNVHTPKKNSTNTTDLGDSWCSRVMKISTSISSTNMEKA